MILWIPKEPCRFHHHQSYLTHIMILFTLYKKGKVIPLQDLCGPAQRVGRGIALLFHDCGTRSAEWSAACPSHTLPQEKTRYPFYRRMGGPQGRSGQVENLVPTEIRSQNVQPIVSHYTNWFTLYGTVKFHLQYESVKCFWFNQESSNHLGFWIPMKYIMCFSIK